MHHLKNILIANFCQVLFRILLFDSYNNPLRENFLLNSFFTPADWSLKKRSNLLKIIGSIVRRVGFKPKSVDSWSLCPHPCYCTISHIERTWICPELSALREMYYIYSVQYWLHATLEHLKYGLCDWGIKCLLLSHFNSFKFKYLHVASGYCTGEQRPRCLLDYVGPAEYNSTAQWKEKGHQSQAVCLHIPASAPEPAVWTGVAFLALNLTII